MEGGGGQQQARVSKGGRKRKKLPPSALSQCAGNADWRVFPVFSTTFGFILLFFYYFFSTYFNPILILAIIWLFENEVIPRGPRINNSQSSVVIKFKMN